MITWLIALLATWIGALGVRAPSSAQLDQALTIAKPASIQIQTSATPTEVRPLPPVSAAHAIVVDGRSGRILGVKDADTSAPIASITKLTTLLESLKNTPAGVSAIDPSEKLKFSLRETRGSQSGIRNGDVISLRDAWAALLLPSANDVAEWIAESKGDRSSFISAMESTMKDLGFDATFLNASGLDEGAHANTLSVHAVSELIRFLTDIPAIGPILRTERTTITGSDGIAYTLRSTDDLLRQGFPVKAAKTGTSDLAGQNIAVWLEDADLSAIIVVTGSQDRYGDAKTLWNWAKQNYTISIDSQP